MKKIIFITTLFLINISALHAQHLKKDGTPDRRFKENRRTTNSSSGINTNIAQQSTTSNSNTSNADTIKNSVVSDQNNNSFIQCSGITKKGTRCKRMTNSANGRCFQH